MGTAKLAQLVEQLLCNQQVVGSNPTLSTKFGRLAERTIAPVLKAGMPIGHRRFESYIFLQTIRE